jgi:hypothetical protein
MLSREAAAKLSRALSATKPEVPVQIEPAPEQKAAAERSGKSEAKRSAKAGARRAAKKPAEKKATAKSKPKTKKG